MMTFVAGEQHPRLESCKLGHRDRFEQLLMIELRHQWRIAMVAQAAGVYPGGMKSWPRYIFISGVKPEASPKS